MQELPLAKILYCIDTSALIGGWRRHYSPEVFDGLWQNIEKYIASGKIIACEEVKVELRAKDDELYRWAMKQKNLFRPLTEEQVLTAQKILSTHPGLADPSKVSADADAFVIALAEVENCPVITYETPNASKTKPKIPDVCKAYKIRYINFLDFIKEQGWRF